MSPRLVVPSAAPVETEQLLVLAGEAALVPTFFALLSSGVVLPAALPAFAALVLGLIAAVRAVLRELAKDDQGVPVPPPDWTDEQLDVLHGRTVAVEEPVTEVIDTVPAETWDGLTTRLGAAWDGLEDWLRARYVDAQDRVFPAVRNQIGGA